MRTDESRELERDRMGRTVRMVERPPSLAARGAATAGYTVVLQCGPFPTVENHYSCRASCTMSFRPPPLALSNIRDRVSSTFTPTPPSHSSRARPSTSSGASSTTRRRRRPGGSTSSSHRQGRPRPSSAFARSGRHTTTPTAPPTAGVGTWIQEAVNEAASRERSFENEHVSDVR